MPGIWPSQSAGRLHDAIRKGLAYEDALKDLRKIEHDYAQPAGGECVGNEGARDAGANDHDVGRFGRGRSGPHLAETVGQKPEWCAGMESQRLVRFLLRIEVGIRHRMIHQLRDVCD